MTRISDSRPRHWTPQERDAAVRKLEAMTMKGLRRHQRIVASMTGMAHEQNNTKALENLRAMEAVIDKAIENKEFGNTTT